MQNLLTLGGFRLLLKVKVKHIKEFEFTGQNGATYFSFSLFVWMINVVINDGCFKGPAAVRRWLGSAAQRHGDADPMNQRLYLS